MRIERRADPMRSSSAEPFAAAATSPEARGGAPARLGGWLPPFGRDRVGREEVLAVHFGACCSVLRAIQ
eukprot:972446-Alexandrium_andersonii.AAC.1